MKPKHIRIIDGIPCMAVMEHEEILKQLEAQEPVAWLTKEHLYRLDEDITALRTAIEQAEKQENECGNGAGCLYKISRIEHLEEQLAAAEKRSGNVTFVTLAGKLMALGLVQSEAILDPDGYDGGVQWKAIEKLLRFVKGEDDEH
jgi:hypothetical protein